MRRKRNTPSLKMRIAIICTTLIVAPSALGISVFLKKNVIKHMVVKCKNYVSTDDGDLNSNFVE